MILVLAAALLSVECEVAPWLQDQESAIRDSADVIAEATVSELRLLDTSEDQRSAEVEVSLEVERSWRGSLQERELVLIYSLECEQPDLDIGRSYIVGLWESNRDLLLLAAVPRPQADELVVILGQSRTPRHSFTMVDVGLSRIALVSIAVALAGLTLLLRKPRS